MNLKKLAFPIRLYWDIAPLPDSSVVDYSSICRQIVALKFFTLNLTDTGPSLSSACKEVLEILKDEFITLSLTVSRQVMQSDAMDLFSAAKVNEVLVDVSGSDDLSFVAQCAARHEEEKMTIGASLHVREDNYQSIPGFIASCLEQNIHRLVLPMQRLTGQDSTGCFYVRSSEGSALSERLSKLDFSGMKITIHDPFLWKIFYPSRSFPGGGCQAGNSMAYIAPDGRVYPCPTMPIELGNLCHTPLKTILTSDYKKDLMEQVGRHPEECADCDDLEGCMGGCSGRVYELDGSFDRRDPACQ